MSIHLDNKLHVTFLVARVLPVLVQDIYKTFLESFREKFAKCYGFFHQLQKHEFFFP